MKLIIYTQSVDRNDPILGFFLGWIEAFSRDFEEVFVVCLRKGDYDLPSHVSVFSLGKEEGENRLKYLIRFYRYTTALFFKPGVTHVFFHMGAIYNILAFPFFCIRKIRGIKFYWWKAHGHINFMGRLALLFVDRVYTSTESGFPIQTKKRRVVGQAIDTTTFVPHGQKRIPKHILYAGRIAPIKRIEMFIETLRSLRALDTSYTGTMVGPVTDLEYGEKIQRDIEAYGLSPYLAQVGGKTQAELTLLYGTAEIFLNTSMTESMDKTVLEAILTGCVPVTGNRAFKDLLLQDGLYLDNPSPEGYAEVIHRVCSGDTASLQDRLRARVVAEHSLHTFSQRIFSHD